MKSNEGQVEENGLHWRLQDAIHPEQRAPHVESKEEFDPEFEEELPSDNVESDNEHESENDQSDMSDELDENAAGFEMPVFIPVGGRINLCLYLLNSFVKRVSQHNFVKK